VILHGFWRSSATWRVRIALALKELPYELRPVNLVREGGGDQHTAEHRARNPMRQVPVLELDDEDGERVFLSQSIAIIEYLDERWPAPPLLPRSRSARARARQIAETCNSGIQPLQNTAVREHVKTLGADDADWVRRWVCPGLEALESLVADTAGAYCMGDTLTIADVFVVPQLEFTKRFAIDLARYPTLARITTTCGALEPFRRAHAARQPDAPARNPWTT
jgi:maleylpyruvate isomerase